MTQNKSQNIHIHQKGDDGAVKGLGEGTDHKSKQTSEGYKATGFDSQGGDKLTREECEACVEICGCE